MTQSDDPKLDRCGIIPVLFFVLSIAFTYTSR